MANVNFVLVEGMNPTQKREMLAIQGAAAILVALAEGGRLNTSMHVENAIFIKEIKKALAEEIQTEQK